MSKTMAFNPGKVRFRATFSAGDLDPAQRFGKIDAEKGILYDVQVSIMGEAKGHGVHLGEDFIDGVVEQGNAAKLGLKSHFGHPAMCSDALGTFLGRATNFKKKPVTRPDGSQCSGAFADFQLAEEAKKAPGGDLYSWTLATAQNNPDTFGQSIVFTYSDFYVMDKDGNKKLYSQRCEGCTPDQDPTDEWLASSVDGKIYAMLGNLLGTDFTDTPAATDGVFGTGDLAARAEEMLDANPQIMELLTSKPDTLNQFLHRYNAVLKSAGKPELALSVVGAAPDPASLSALSKKLEDAEKRLSGLQSAKDKEIKELHEAADAAKKTFDSQLANLTSDLSAANSALSIANDGKAKAESALAESGKQLAAKTAALAKLTGDTLTSSEGLENWEEAKAKLGYAPARRQYPELYAAFMKAIKKG